jgi:hypothetical protein
MATRDRLETDRYRPKLNRTASMARRGSTNTFGVPQGATGLV